MSIKILKDKLNALGHKDLVQAITIKAEASKEEAQRFQEIMEELRNLADEAMDIVKGTSAESRASSYWYPHILGAIDKEGSGYLGGSMYDMASALKEIKVDSISDDKIISYFKRKGINVTEIAENVIYFESGTDLDKAGEVADELGLNEHQWVFEIAEEGGPVIPPEKS